jgi:hypothetical protein
MKRNLWLWSLGAVLLLSSCKEKGSLVDFTSTRAVDTTYVLDSAETPEQKRLLVEEATGVVCANCPAATLLLKASEASYPGRLIIVGLHFGQWTQPDDASKYDFRNESVKDIYTLLSSSDPSKPAAAFDRTPSEGNYFERARIKWPAIIDQRLQAKTPLNLSLTSSFNTETREDTIRIRVSYTEAFSKAQKIGIVITESNIADFQLDGLKPDTFYTHNHVLREFVVPVNGHSFLDSLTTKEPGRVYERTYIFKIPDYATSDEKRKWNIENCYVVGLVFNNEAGDIEVVQSVEVKLKQ